MAAASVVGASSVDMVFQTRVLRPFLHHPGVHVSGGGREGFLKPAHPAHSPLPRASTSVQPLSLRPFQAVDPEVQQQRHGDGRRGAPAGASPPGGRRRATQQRFRVVSGAAALDRPAADGDATGDLAILSVQSSAAEAARCSSGARRRCPVHDVLLEDDPSLMHFPEDSDDPRVYMPAHRIGDSPPEGTRLAARPRPAKTQPLSLTRPPRLQKTSQSSPALFIGAHASGRGGAKGCLRRAAEDRGAFGRVFSERPSSQASPDIFSGREL